MRAIKQQGAVYRDSERGGWVTDYVDGRRRKVRAKTTPTSFGQLRRAETSRLRSGLRRRWERHGRPGARYSPARSLGVTGELAARAGVSQRTTTSALRILRASSATCNCARSTLPASRRRSTTSPPARSAKAARFSRRHAQADAFDAVPGARPRGAPARARLQLGAHGRADTYHGTHRA